MTFHSAFLIICYGHSISHEMLDRDHIFYVNDSQYCKTVSSIADEIARQLISSGTKAVITAAEISSTVITAVNKSIPGARVIVVNDHTKPIPDGVIPFEVNKREFN